MFAPLLHSLKVSVSAEQFTVDVHQHSVISIEMIMMFSTVTDATESVDRDQPTGMSVHIYTATWKCYMCSEPRHAIKEGLHS